jgi:hypothetical protein
VRKLELIMILASWRLDDAWPTTLIQTFPNRHGQLTGQTLEQIWTDQFD